MRSTNWPRDSTEGRCGRREHGAVEATVAFSLSGHWQHRIGTGSCVLAALPWAAAVGKWGQPRAYSRALSPPPPKEPLKVHLTRSCCWVVVQTHWRSGRQPPAALFRSTLSSRLYSLSLGCHLALLCLKMMGHLSGILRQRLEFLRR